MVKLAKRNLNWNQDKYNRFIKEGRGEGSGKNYKPWLTIQDFPSLGRVSRVLGWKTDRIHHLFSDLQTKYFYMLEWAEQIIDIREHFPLLDVEETIRDKEDLRFDLFSDKESQTPYIISTNFLITVKNTRGGTYHLAREVKSASELDKKRTLETLEIKRRYWEAKGIDWGIVTNKEINTAFAKNVEWIHSALYSYGEQGLSQEDTVALSKILLERLSNKEGSIRNSTTDFDYEFQLASGTGLFILKYLIANKQIEFDMMSPININASTNEIKVNHQLTQWEGKIICL